ncbi:hypothetical protein PsYK624_135070 [Phanerochaete sordida]|uniref:Uncharacterized protein n=1 Tax=Phanerochaete sordida TaxID=48140 RepID=A0A9P3GM51_9APHY|nr:hypothetical protein PsYK624_135070 [Phanerochaete sordida]
MPPKQATPAQAAPAVAHLNKFAALDAAPAGNAPPGIPVDARADPVFNASLDRLISEASSDGTSSMDDDTPRLGLADVFGPVTALLQQAHDHLIRHHAVAIELTRALEEPPEAAPVVLLSTAMQAFLAGWLDVARHNQWLLRTAFPEYTLASRLADAQANALQLQEQLAVHTELTAAMNKLQLNDAEFQERVVRMQATVGTVLTTTRDVGQAVLGIAQAGPAPAAPASAAAARVAVPPVNVAGGQASARKRSLFTDASGRPRASEPPKKKAREAAAAAAPPAAPSGDVTLVLPPNADFRALSTAASVIAQADGLAGSDLATIMHVAKDFNIQPRGAPAPPPPSSYAAAAAGAPESSPPTAPPPAAPRAAKSGAGARAKGKESKKKKVPITHYPAPAGANNIVRVNYATPVPVTERLASADVQLIVNAAHAAASEHGPDSPPPRVVTATWHIDGSQLDVRFEPRPEPAVVHELDRNHHPRFGSDVRDLGFYVHITQLVVQGVLVRRVDGTPIPIEDTLASIKANWAAEKAANGVVHSNLLGVDQHPKPEVRNVIGPTAQLVIAIYDDVEGSRASAALDIGRLRIGESWHPLSLWTAPRRNPQCTRCLYWGHRTHNCRAQHEHCSLCHLPHPTDFHDSFCMACSDTRAARGVASVVCPRVDQHLSCANCGKEGHGPTDSVCKWSRNAFSSSWLANHKPAVAVRDLISEQRQGGGDKDVARGKRQTAKQAEKLATQAASLGIADSAPASSSGPAAQESMMDADS